MHTPIYILVCASVRSCDDQLESFNVFNLLAPLYSFMRTPRYLICVGLRQFRLILLRVLVNLENRQTRIKLMFAYLKHNYVDVQIAWVLVFIHLKTLS